MEPELIGVNEIAALSGYSPSTVASRISYFPDFPKPIRLTPKAKRFWKKSEILEYLDMKQQRAA